MGRSHASAWHHARHPMVVPAPVAGRTLLALALTAGDAATRIRHTDFVSSISGAVAAPPAVDPASPTGCTLGRRRLILAGGEDGLQWIMQTQMMLAGGGARIHHVAYDNAPTGRATWRTGCGRAWAPGGRSSSAPRRSPTI
jgi:hypothetical protein